MKNTEKHFNNVVLEQALSLHERGVGVSEIAERFPGEEARLREAFTILSLMKEAGSAVRPTEHLLRRILESLGSSASALAGGPRPWEEVRRAMPFWVRARWRISLPVALVGAVAALLAVLERAEAPSPLPNLESRVAEKSAPPAQSLENLREGPAITMFSAPLPAAVPSSRGGSAFGGSSRGAEAGPPAFTPAPVAATAAPESSPPDFVAIFAEEDALIAAEEDNAALAQSGSSFNDIGNSYDEATI